MVSKLDEQDDIVNRKGDPPGNKHPQEPRMRGIPGQVEGSEPSYYDDIDAKMNKEAPQGRF
jgi:hypothetical protein